MEKRSVFVVLSVLLVFGIGVTSASTRSLLKELIRQLDDLNEVTPKRPLPPTTTPPPGEDGDVNEEVEGITGSDDVEGGEQEGGEAGNETIEGGDEGDEGIEGGDEGGDIEATKGEGHNYETGGGEEVVIDQDTSDGEGKDHPRRGSLKQSAIRLAELVEGISRILAMKAKNLEKIDEVLLDGPDASMPSTERLVIMQERLEIMSSQFDAMEDALRKFMDQLFDRFDKFAQLALAENKNRKGTEDSEGINIGEEPIRN